VLKQVLRTSDPLTTICLRLWKVMAADPNVDDLEKRARAGDVDAARNLALYLELGGNGLPDFKLARGYWEIAASKGDGFAMACLADIIANGRDGSAPNPTLGNQWRAKAAEKGVLNVDDRMEVLKSAEIAPTNAALEKIANKILIVDDSDVTRTVVGAALRNSGFNVVDATDGAEALSKLKELINVKLVITDMNMPNMNGLQLLSFLRKTKEFRDLPVVVLSTESDVEVIKQAKALGIAGWLLKPAKPDALESVAKRFVGGR
jgi:two-component system chemotaxis response regulator CheY